MSPPLQRGRSEEELFQTAMPLLSRRPLTPIALLRFYRCLSAPDVIRFAGMSEPVISFLRRGCLEAASSRELKNQRLHRGGSREAGERKKKQKTFSFLFYVCFFFCLPILRFLPVVLQTASPNRFNRALLSDLHQLVTTDCIH